MPIAVDTATHDDLTRQLEQCEADGEKMAAEIERLRYWLRKLDRDDIVTDADKFAGPEEERRRDALEQSVRNDK